MTVITAIPSAPATGSADMTSDGHWALVTGASSGLGIALAERLAARGNNLVLVARREAPMRELERRLTQDYGIEVIVEPSDLAETGSAARLYARLQARGISPDILINNAGFGLAGPFVGQDPARLQDMLQLDIVALTELTHVFAPAMVARGRGHILLIASIAAYSPTPMMAAYGAAKAYVLSFGHALHAELAPAVTVTVLAPGLMDTGFLNVAGFTPTDGMRRTMLTPARVAAIGLDALFAGRSSVVAGRMNRMMTLLTRVLPRHWQAWIGHRLMKV